MTAPDGGSVTSASQATPSIARPLLLLAAALAVAAIAYLTFAVPASWFPGATAKTWGARDLSLVRGTGAIVNNELVLTGVDNNGQALIALSSDLPARDYAAIAWDVRDVPATTDVRLVWRSDYAPQKVISVPVPIQSEQLLPVIVVEDPGWLGRVNGLALLIRGPLSQPIRIRGVTAKPMGAVETLSDRIREWWSFERWTGTSINSVTGGADVQDLPLPLLLAVAIAATALLVWALARWRRLPRRSTLAWTIAVVFAASWGLLDARWLWNLARQTQVTAAQYAGKDWREKHRAADDGGLFAFIEQVRATLPAAPVRVFVVSDAHYFRGRAAFHLYPHNVFFESSRNVMPPPANLRAGDWLLVYQRRGVQFDPSANRLRWDNATPAAVQLKLTGPGAALFQIQ
ncbi:MAG: hypothetical protein H0T80_02400 [Betaproteobacteria bacterium]|nr:hypothetical protein [Betaproteobacteria bacterium]